MVAALSPTGVAGISRLDALSCTSQLAGYINLMWNTQALGPTLAFLQSSGAGDQNRGHTHIPSLVCQLQHHGLPTASTPGFDMLSADVSLGQTKSVITNLNQIWNVTTSYPDQHRQELVLIGMMQGSCVNMRSHHAGRDEAIELFHGLCARYNRCSDAQCPAAHGCHTYPIVKSYRNTINPSQWLHGLQFMTSNIEGTPQGSRFGASDPNSAHGPFGARLVSHQP